MNRDGGLESDLDVIRGLLQKYGFQQFENMVHIAGRSLYEPSISSSSRASVISSAATSNSFYTDASSLKSGMYMPPLPVRSSNASVASRTSTPSFAPDVPSLPDPTDQDPDVSRAKLQCPFCTEYGIGQWIGRKPDLKRHFNKIHASNAQWTCRLGGGGCNLTFDFHTAYDAHVKKEHGGVKDHDAKVDLCPQVVWACGFETCREVFEAKSDDHVPKIMNSYFEHVLGHVISSACGGWSYTRRMRNLLHQELVRHAWKDCDKGPRDELVWQPQSSSTLRKILETRHVADAALLCKYAVLLGQGHPAPPLPLPLLNTCKVASPSHESRASKGGLLGFGRKSNAPKPPRPSGRITGSQPKSRINVLRSPQPPPLMRPQAAAPTLFAPHPHPSNFVPDFPAAQSALPDLDYPLGLYSGYQFLDIRDNPPGAGDRQQHRPRRNSSPGSDYRMESPTADFAQPFQPQQGRRAGTTMDFDFAS